MKISEKLQFILNISGLTQEKIAKELEVSFATLNSWINERSTPHKKKQEAIDEVYKKYTGQNVIPDTELQAKKDFIAKKSKKFGSIIKFITSRPDIYEQIELSLTYNTNSIEGSTLTEKETADILFRNINIKNKSLKENLEAKNHQTALRYLFKVIKTDFKIDEDFILRLHSILMNGILDNAGQYRRHGVRIVGAGVPTANYIKLPNLMRDLIIEINKKESDAIKHVSAIHSKFEMIHPFSDGNGRIGRLIMAAMLFGKDYPLAIIKQENKSFYYRYLQKSQLQNDVSLLEDFICDSIISIMDIME